MKNIYQRLADVAKKVTYIQKDKRVENYMAVTHDAVTAVVRQHFLEEGVVMVPKVLSSQTVTTTRTSKNGTPLLRYEGRFEVSFVNTDEPADRVVTEVDAHADDYGDKAPGKALSYACKGAILKVLMIETGESDESRVGPAEEPLGEAEEVALQELRDAAINGTEALKTAWAGMSKPIRRALAAQLDSLKEAAAQADGASNA